jgi:hypothetical protein
MLRVGALLMVFLLGCAAPGSERPTGDDDGSGGDEGQGDGGRGAGGRGGAVHGSGGIEMMGSGGMGSGGSDMTGGSLGAGGAGGIAMMMTGGSGAGGTIPVEDPDCPKSNPPKFCSVKLYLVNCVFCHVPTAEDKILKSDFSEGDGLYDRLVNKVAVATATAKCANRTLVVPGHPEKSLLYLKLQAGSMPDLLPATCGKPMPSQAKDQTKMPLPFTAGELKLFFDWIMGGAKR